MNITGQVMNWSLLIGLVGCSWLLPRRLGLIGIIVSQVLVAAGFIIMGRVALETGVWDRYDGPLNIVGLLIQAFVLNLLLLPVACAAVWKRRRSLAAVDRTLVCVRCGYNPTGNASGVCPECGATVQREVQR